MKSPREPNNDAWRGPDQRKRDTVLAAVKDATRRLRRWPAAILDSVCARRHWTDAGRDEETALGRTKKLSRSGIGCGAYRPRIAGRLGLTWRPCRLGGRLACLCAGRLAADCGKSAAACRTTGSRALCFLLLKAGLASCTVSSTRRR